MNKTIEIGDTVRLKKLKEDKIYYDTKSGMGLTCYKGMITNERLTVKDLWLNKVQMSNGFIYDYSMIDIRTLRKRKPEAGVREN